MKQGFVLTLLAVFAFFVSALIFNFVPSKKCHMDIDSPEYEKIALNFSQNGTLKHPERITSHPLGYPLFLGIIYKFFDNSNSWAIFFQIILSILSMFLIFRISLLLFNYNVAKIALFLLSINIGFFVYPQFILADSLYTFLLALFVERFLKFFYTQNIYYLVMSGFVLGISVVVRPVALYFVWLLLFFMLFFCGQRFFIKLKNILIFSFCFWITVFGYMSYNYQVYGQMKVTSLTEEGIYHYFTRILLAEIKGISLEQADSHVGSLKCSKVRDCLWNKKSFNVKKEFLFGLMKRNQLLTIFVFTRTCLKVLVGNYSTQLKILFEEKLKGGECSFFKGRGTFFQKLKSYVSCGTTSYPLIVCGWFELFYNFLRLFFVLLALIYMAMYRKIGVLCFSLLFLASFIGCTFFDGCARYRMMVEPLFLPLASFGIYVLYCWFRKCKVNADNLLVNKGF